MKPVPEINEIHVTAAGDMWDAELAPFWPAEFARVLAAGASREIITSELAYISNTKAGDAPNDFAEGASGVEAIKRTDGIFFMLARPPKPWQTRRLLDGFVAARREPRAVPLVILASRPRPWPESFEAGLLDHFSWPLCAVVGVDVVTGEGIAAACERMLELIARAPFRATPRA